MRILMVSKFYWLLGGVERYVRELSQLLEQRGHQIIPFAMQDRSPILPTCTISTTTSPLRCWTRSRNSASQP
jgi:hypothetical protein